jgi:hypothetical protein
VLLKVVEAAVAHKQWAGQLLVVVVEGRGRNAVVAEKTTSRSVAIRDSKLERGRGGIGWQCWLEE